VVAGFVILRRSHRRQDDLLNFSLTGAKFPDRQQGGEVASLARTYLAERTVIIGSLVARAASEIYLQRNELPTGAEVITRQIQNALLRQSGLWVKLEPVETDLVGVADGRWTPDQHNQVAAWCEQLRLLRWTLGVDAELIPLAHFPRVDFSLSRGLLSPAEVLSQSKRILESWEVRVERDIALQYLARVVAELKGRALIPDDAALEAWAGPLREASLGPSTDYLAGSKTVGELDNESLRLLGVVTASRERYAAYLVDQLATDNCVSFSAWLGSA